MTETRDARAYIASLVKPGRTPVVEVGPGKCACLTILLARRGLRVLALDREAEAAGGARRATRRAGLARRVRVVQADAASMPLRPGSVRTVIAYDALHHAIELGRTNRGIAAALRPGGLLIVGDEDEARNGFLGRLVQALRANFRGVAIRALGGERVYLCEGPQGIGKTMRSLRSRSSSSGQAIWHGPRWSKVRQAHG